MITSIIILKKQQYGNNVYYPVCDMAHKFAALIGTKTLTPQALRTIESMGVRVQVTHPDDEFQLKG